MGLLKVIEMYIHKKVERKRDIEISIQGFVFLERFTTWEYNIDIIPCQ